MSQARTLGHLYQQAALTGRPLLGGHRGNPAEFPENTLASFQSAIALGCDMIECDVHMSSDGHLIVIHDHTVDRTTDGTGLVGEQTLAQLRALDAGRGERLPLLQEVVDLARATGTGLCVELKQLPIPYPGLEGKLVQMLRLAGMVEHTAVISFYHPSVLDLKLLEPGLQAGILIDVGVPVEDPVELLRAAQADIYAPYYDDLTQAQVQAVHQAGGVVGVWTVDDEAGVEHCRRTLPDSIFTNFPRRIIPQFRN